MQHNKTLRDWVVTYLQIVIGAALYAAGFQFFLYPNAISTGGLTGIAMIINFFSGLPVGVMTMIMNIPLFIFSWKRFGLNFIIASLVGTVLSSVFVDLFAQIPLEVTHEPLLGAIYGGIIKGFGLGLEESGVKHHSVAYYVLLVALEHSRRDGFEHEFLAVKDKGMAGVGTTLESGHHIITRCKHIHYLTFTFITPLQSQKDINLFCFHFLSLCVLFILFCFLLRSALHLLQRPYILSTHPVALNRGVRMTAI